jgi:hypothetical protein
LCNKDNFAPFSKQFQPSNLEAKCSDLFSNSAYDVQNCKGQFMTSNVAVNEQADSISIVLIVHLDLRHYIFHIHQLKFLFLADDM